MSRGAIVRITQGLVLELSSVSESKTVVVQLTRIGAQHLTDALLEYAGVKSKSYSRGADTQFAAIDVTPTSPRPTQAKAAPKVRVGGPRVVRLGRR